MDAYILIKVLHVIAGGLALIFGLLAIVYRRKTKTHKPLGRIYFWSMGFIFVSALYMASVKFNLFLLGVAFFSYYSCLTAFRALRLKRLHMGQKPALMDWSIELVFSLAHLSFVIYAVLHLVHGNFSIGLVALVFGLLGLSGNWGTYKRFTTKPEYKNFWLLTHLGGMLGSYIAAITAFAVNNSRWIPVPEIILWLGPTVLIVPFIIHEVRIQKQLGGNLNGN